MTLRQVLAFSNVQLKLDHAQFLAILTKIHAFEQETFMELTKNAKLVFLYSSPSHSSANSLLSFKVVLDKILPIFLFFEKPKHWLYIVSSKTKSKLNQKQRNHAMFVISLSKTLIFLEHRNDGIRWFNCSQFKWHGV